MTEKEEVKKTIKQDLLVCRNELYEELARLQNLIQEDTSDRIALIFEEIYDVNTELKKY